MITFRQVRYILMFLLCYWLLDNVIAQNDTNIVFGDSVLFKSEICNKIVNGKKEGLHYTFGFEDTYKVIHTDYSNGSYKTKHIYHNIRPV